MVDSSPPVPLRSTDGYSHLAPAGHLLSRLLLVAFASLLTLVANAEYMPFDFSIYKVNDKTVSLPDIAVTGDSVLRLQIVSPFVPFDKNNVSLHQRASGGLVMPLPTQIAVRPIRTDTEVISQTSVQLPEVKNITSAFLLFDFKTERTLEKRQLPITIFPPEDMESTGRALNRKIEESKWRLAVVSKKDKDRLGDFLTKRKVDFSSAESLAADTLILVDATAKDFKNMLPAADGTRILAFVETSDSLMPPRIHTTQTADGTVITTVTLPILTDLETNPRHREIFLNLLNQHLNRNIANE